MKPPRTSRRSVRVTAMVATAVAGLALGLLIAGRLSSDTDDAGQLSTDQLLAGLRKHDSAMKRTYRRFALRLPVSWQARFSFARPIHPDTVKPPYLRLLAARTNESAVIVPALVEQLNALKPHDFLTAEYVMALSAHGVEASNAVPWLERVAQAPTNLFRLTTRSPFGGRVSLGEVYAALIAIKGDATKYFGVLTNRLWELGFPERTGVSNRALEAQTGFTQQVDEHLRVLAGFKVDLSMRSEVLRCLLASPSPIVRTGAWSQLVNLAPELPELAIVARERLQSGPIDAMLHLPAYLKLATYHSGLLDDLAPHIQAQLREGSFYGYWQMVNYIVANEAGLQRFADEVALGFFANRLSGFAVTQSAFSPGYNFPPALGRFLRASDADLSGLRQQLQAAALDMGNSHRFDDAQVLTLLGGDPEFERSLLEDAFDEASADARKTAALRYPRVQAEPAVVASFLESHLDDPEPQVRRVVLEELARLGTNAVPLLGRIDRTHSNDVSQIVRWQARRTANTLRGLDPNEGIREPRRRIRTDQ